MNGCIYREVRNPKPNCLKVLQIRGVYSINIYRIDQFLPQSITERAWDLDALLLADSGNHGGTAG